MKKLILIIIVFIILMPGCSLIKNNNKDWNSVSNSANRNIFFGYNGDIYFNNISELGIYKFNKDPKKTIKIADGLFGRVLIKDDWIYTTIGTDQELGLYKMKIDGREVTQLSNKKTFQVIKGDEYLYYFHPHEKNGGIYKVRNDGTEEEKLVDDYMIYYLYIYDEWIYYLSGARLLYRIKTDGSDKQNLSTDEALFMVMDDEWIYYFNGMRRIKGIRHDGTNESLIKEDNNHFNEYMNIKDDWLYISTRTKTSRYSDWILYKINVSTKEEVLLYEGVVENIHIINNQIYFYADLSFYRMDLDGNNIVKLFDYSM
ncbi:DUF5050 domain-containing protein [Alkaliphilus peptidifermentans]|uniref:Prolow-density lipoprotein receptor-related protein 1-like beta-propeller domain-containing protein n=1 Tax=Alkaliphilus peptidifermentans DSM 18978 TaxID=1120976 RepID=A0A1G5KYI2_9FIRM|nr:DUF5050 domain-containing protein [Alkaliphilus peptidifermentans]SCZ05178.1 protein of unknown function [Alkaliphilus peptidifermentans DSM 18978]